MNKKISIAVSLALIGLLAWYITDNYVMKEPEFMLHASYDDITGLTASDPVMYNGYQIGEIEEIRVHPKNSEWMVVYFSISEKGIKIPVDSKAELISVDLLGNRAISIIMGDSTKMAVSGDSLWGGEEMEFSDRIMNRFAPVKDHLAELMGKTKASFSNVTGIFDSTTTTQMKRNFEVMQKAIRTLKATKEAIDTLMVHEKHKFSNIKGNMSELMAAIKKDSIRIEKALNDACEFSSTLLSFNMQGALAQAKLMQQDLTDIQAELKKAEGTLGRLMYTQQMQEAISDLQAEINRFIKYANTNFDKLLNFSVFGKKVNNKKLNSLEKKRLDSLIQMYPQLEEQLKK